jgi:LuxR family transcriptional regulator, maltose regulon positive regulatory protein
MGESNIFDGTATANGAAEMIKEIFAQIKTDDLEILFRMDSGYFDDDIITTIESAGCQYLIKGKEYPRLGPEGAKILRPFRLESTYPMASSETEPMSSPLLATKFFFPPPRPEQVSRPRLLARLDECLTRKLALVCAPAGYGKSTLIVEWTSKIPDARVGWLSLDAGENDPTRFLSYLITSMQQAMPSTGERALAMLCSPRVGSTKVLPSETLLNLLVNDLAMTTDPIVLILEDYHVIQAEAIHQYIAYLLDHLPANVHLVLTSRAEPPLPLARLRVRGQLVEVRTEDLRFTEDEANEFLNRSMRLSLDNNKVALLSTRTEGWIAGLLMAAVSMLRREDVDAFINDFTGSNRYIMDYLVEEVLQQQPDHILLFLNYTCPLDRLCGELCDEVMAEAFDYAGSPGVELPFPSSSLLSSLERANLFIVPLDDRQEWYRYHRLFADLLRKRLGLASPELVPRIHQKASQWFERKGNMPEAIDHCFLAGNFERAASLIEQAAETILRRSETSLLLKWVEKIPESLMITRPRLGLFHALALIISSQKYEQVEARLVQAQEAPPEGALAGEVATVQGLLTMMRGEIQRSIHLSRRALEDLPEERLLFKCLAADNLGMCYVLVGDMPSAIPAFEETVTLARRSGNIMMAAGALSNLAGLQYLQGHMRDAWVNYQKIVELSTDTGGRRLPVAGKALIGLGELAREWNDLEAAANYLSEAVELLSHFVEIGLVICYLSLARVMQAQEDWEKAWELLSKAQELALESTSIPIDDRLVEVTQALFWIRQGNYEQAFSWSQKRKLDENVLAEIRRSAGSLGYEMLEPEYLVLARLLIVQGQPEKALSILTAIQAFDEQKGRGRRLVEVLCLQAIAYQARGEIDTALSVLQCSLALGKQEGFVRTFIDEGEPVLHLLTLAIQRGIEPEYATWLKASMQAKQPHTQKSIQPSAVSRHFPPISSEKPFADVIEPLSGREIEVLQLIALGLSNSEIGARLVISLSTVKGHTANIYSKLGVNNRTQAVSKARQIGIL